MALTGVMVSCTTVTERSGASLTSDIQWSQSFNSGTGVTSNQVQSDNLMFEVAAAQDTYVCFGDTPDNPASAASRRILVRAGETRNLFAQKGHRVAVAPAS
jgi:hypothetical protein